MDGLTHSAFGAACWLGGAYLARAGHVAEAAGAVAAAVAAPWCDIDNVGAWGSRRKGALGVRWRKHPVRYRVALAVSVFGKHRQGPAHSLLVAPLLGVLAALPHARWAWWPLWAGAAISTGLASHILLDLANKRPVRLLWPWDLEAGGLGVPVGGAAELLLVRPLLLAALIGEGWLAFHP
jgi:membrane-bound metal-dependent hydrolase YbcI (DUF457 family)